MGTDYLRDLTASSPSQINYDQTAFDDKLKEIDDGSLGNKDNKIDEKELKEVFQEMGLSASEAWELAKYFFNQDNGFMKSGDGGLDIEKVFAFLDSDDNDSNVSTPELKMTGSATSRNVKPTSDNKQETTIGKGNDAFKINEEHREIAMGMIKSDGTLDTEALHEYLKSDPPPSAEDKKAVVFSALLGAGYDEDDILTNLNNIIKQIEEGENLPKDSDKPTDGIAKTDAKEKISNHVDGTSIDEDGLKEEIMKMFTDMGMGKEIAEKLADAYMESPEFEAAEGKNSESDIVDALTDGLFKFLGKEDDETIDAEDLFEDEGDGQVKKPILEKMGEDFENLSNPPTTDEIETFLGDDDIDIKENEELGQLIEVMLGNEASPENVQKVRDKLSEKLGNDGATAEDIAKEIGTIVKDVKNGETTTEEGSKKSYSTEEFSNMIKHDDPAHEGKINPEKLKKELIALGVDPDVAKAFATLSEGAKTADIVEQLKGSDDKISLESVNKALKNQSYEASDAQKKITGEDGKLDNDKLENLFTALGMEPDKSKTYASTFKGQEPNEVVDLIKDTDGNVTPESINNATDKQSYGGYEFRDAVKGEDGKVDTGKLANILTSLGIDADIAEEFADTFEGKNADSKFLKIFQDDEGNITKASAQDAIDNQGMTTQDFKDKIKTSDGKVDFDKLEDVMKSLGVPVRYVDGVIENLKESNPTLDTVANMFADPDGNITPTSMMDRVENSIDVPNADETERNKKNRQKVVSLLESSGIDAGDMDSDFITEFSKQFGDLDEGQIKVMLDTNNDGKLDDADKEALKDYTKDDVDKSKQLGKLDSFRDGGNDDTKVKTENKDEILKILRLSGATASDGKAYEWDDIKDKTIGNIKGYVNGVEAS